MHVVKNQELLNTVDKNLAKATRRPNMILVMFIYERVFARSVKKSKKILPRFYMHLKNKDHTINNTLFLRITTGILFILSLKRPLSNYETKNLLISVTH